MSKLNAAIALCNAFLCQSIPHHRSRSQTEADVVVLASEAIGDNLVFLDVLHYIENHNTNENTKTVFICNKKMQSFWESNKKIQSTIIIPVEKQFSKETTDNIKKIQRMRIGRLVLPMHHTLSVIIANEFRSDRLYAMLYNEWFRNRRQYIKKLYKSGNKQITWIEDGFFIGSAYERFMNEIYGEEYLWGLPQVKIKKKPVIYGDYVFFAPFSNLPERSLNEKQILEIVDHVLNRENYTVILTGTNNDQKEAKRISNKIHTSRLVNLVGKTSFDEYLNLIANSRVVVGTDSGSIHYAASFGVKSVVLAGLWSGAFLPYATNKYDVYPKCVYTKMEMDCKYCLNKPGGIRASNNICFENTKNGKRRICLENIDIEDVKHAISEYL